MGYQVHIQPSGLFSPLLDRVVQIGAVQIWLWSLVAGFLERLNLSRIDRPANSRKRSSLAGPLQHGRFPAGEG